MTRRIVALKAGDEVPDGATFLCVHAVTERVMVEHDGARALDHESGEMVPMPSWRPETREVPYVWFLLPGRTDLKALADAALRGSGESPIQLQRAEPVDAAHVTTMKPLGIVCQHWGPDRTCAWPSCGCR